MIYLSVRTVLMSWTVWRTLGAVLTTVTTRVAACLQVCSVMESGTVWMARMRPTAVGWKDLRILLRERDCISHFSCSLWVMICFIWNLHQRTKRQMNMKRKKRPLQCSLSLLALHPPSSVLWALNSARMKRSVSSTAMSVMEKRTAEMAQMKKNAH